MNGVVDNRQALANFGLIWREFGPRCAVRCLGAILRRRQTTFLDIAFATGDRTRAARSNVS